MTIGYILIGLTVLDDAEL